MKEHEVFLFKPYMVNIIREIREIRGYNLLFFRVGFGLICDYRFQTMVLNRYGKCTCPEFIVGFAGRLKPLDDIHRRCQYKSLRAFVAKKSCLRNPRNQRLIKTVKSVKSVAKNITYLKKQTQFYAVFGLKTAIYRKTKPIKPNPNPIQTQFYTFLCKMNPNFLIISPKTTISPKNEPKTNPKQSQFKPNFGQSSVTSAGCFRETNAGSRRRENS